MIQKMGVGSFVCVCERERERGRDLATMLTNFAKKMGL